MHEHKWGLLRVNIFVLFLRAWNSVHGQNVSIVCCHLMTFKFEAMVHHNFVNTFMHLRRRGFHERHFLSFINEILKQAEISFFCFIYGLLLQVVANICNIITEGGLGCLIEHC